MKLLPDKSEPNIVKSLGHIETVLYPNNSIVNLVAMTSLPKSIVTHSPLTPFVTEYRIRLLLASRCPLYIPGSKLESYCRIVRS